MGAVKMDWALFWLVAFCFVGTLIVLQNFERLSVWVRRRLFRSGINGDIPERNYPAPASGHIRPTAPDSGTYMAHKQIKWGQWLGELGAFVWKAKWALLILALFIAGVSLVGAFDFGKSKDTLRAERDAALVDKAVTGHERDVATRAAELAERTHADSARVREVVAQAEEDLEDAVSQADFDRLYRVYVAGYCGVLDDPGCADRPDSDPAGLAPVRRPDSSPV